MGEPLFYEDLNVGDRWQSRARTLTEADVVSFACLTGDFDPLHVDHEFARSTPFRKPIAHGLLGLSWVAGLGSNAPTVSTLAFLGVKGWEFIKPIYFGDTLHVINEIAELRPNGRKRGFVVWNRSLVNQSGEVVQKGTFETLVACGSIKARSKTETAESTPRATPSSKKDSKTGRLAE